MFHLLLILIMVLELNATFVEAKITKHLTNETRMNYALHIAEAAVANKIDPLLISAIMYTESNFQNLKENKTHDFGLMQVHWQPSMPWLKGVSKRDLMNPAINIRVGVIELAHVRDFCLKRMRHKPWQHPWWSHYLAGPYVIKTGYPIRNRRIRRYAHLIKRRFNWFKRVRKQIRKKSDLHFTGSTVRTLTTELRIQNTRPKKN